MIIDGVEVLYTMRNGKIVDPNIPMDGLVCYLDTRGKYNTDVYRNTLLDLSGNGNHGTLTNFNFTDGSGFENGGLKFDGVDDIFSNKIVDISNQNSSIYIEGTLSELDYKYNSLLYFGNEVNKEDGFFWLLTYPQKILHLQYLEGTSLKFPPIKQIPTLSFEFKILLVLTKTHIRIWVNGEYSEYPIVYSEKVNSLWLFRKPRGNVSEYITKGDLKKCMVWDRVLTDEEIAQLMEV